MDTSQPIGTTSTFAVSLPIHLAAQVHDEADEQNTSPDRVVAEALFSGKFIGRGVRPAVELQAAVRQMAARMQELESASGFKGQRQQVRELKERLTQLASDLEANRPVGRSPSGGAPIAAHATFFVKIPLPIGRLLLDQAMTARVAPSEVVTDALADGRYVGMGPDPICEIRSALVHVSQNRALLELLGRASPQTVETEESFQE